jgi:hypothetical protein
MDFPNISKKKLKKLLFFVQNHALRISFYVLNAKITFSSTENKGSKPAFSKEIIAIKTTSKVITNHQAIFSPSLDASFSLFLHFIIKKTDFFPFETTKCH